MPYRSLSSRATAVVLIFLLVAGIPLASQQPTYSVKVKVVNVLATVRDKHKQIVNSLNKDDFILEDDGRPQAISYFSKESDLALTLGLLVDTSLSQRRVLDQERSASNSSLDNMLRPDKDQAFLIHFDYQVELLQDLTSSREKLEEALRNLQMPEMERPGNGQPGGGNAPPGGRGGGWPGGRGGGGGRGQRGGGRALYDAVYLASDELMKKQQGRKALVILSDGVDRGSKVGLETAIETAQRSDTVVYSILFADEESNRGGFGGMGGGRGGWGRGGGRGRYPQQERPDGKKILDRLSKETGGRMFEVSKKETIDQIYASIADELRHQYSLGYTPDGGGTPGYHKIHLATKEKDMAVQTRTCYYAAAQ